MWVGSPGQDDSLEEGMLWSSYWESPMDRGAWWAKVHGVGKSQKQLKQLSIYACLISKYNLDLYISLYVHFTPKDNSILNSS